MNKLHRHTLRTLYALRQQKYARSILRRCVQTVDALPPVPADFKDFLGWCDRRFDEQSFLIAVVDHMADQFRILGVITGRCKLADQGPRCPTVVIKAAYVDDFQSGEVVLTVKNVLLDGALREALRAQQDSHGQSKSGLVAVDGLVNEEISYFVARSKGFSRVLNGK